MDTLGITTPKREQKKWLQFVRFRDLERWDISNVQSSISAKYSVLQLSKTDFITKVFRGKSPKYHDNTNSFVLNQKCNRWDFIDLQYAKSVDTQWLHWLNSDIKTQIWDIIVNSTWEWTLWRSSLVRAWFDLLLCDSHMLLLRVNPKYIDPSFLVKQINSSFLQEQINGIKWAKATNQTELWVDNLMNLHFVIPEIHIQSQIVEHIDAIKATITSARTRAESLRNEAKDSLERELFS